MPFVHRPLSIPFPTSPADAQADGVGNWYILDREGALIVLSSDGVLQRRLALDLSGLDSGLRFVLRIAAGGGFGAIAEEYGTRGLVFELSQGGITMRLRRGDYQVEHCMFPLSFVAHRGRDVLVHGTDWNRLDITDPVSGELLTPRVSPDSRREGPDPEHYLDHFYGRLLPSPNGELIAEYGWRWHPWGQVRVWSFSRWRLENVWESEDGPSLEDDLTGHPYFWDGPMAWVDDRHLAIWGLAGEAQPENEDEEPSEEIRPGVRIFDGVSGKETFAFSGPSVSAKPYVPGYGTLTGWIACDRFLYSVSPEESSVSVWRVDKGEYLHRESNFAPISHHRETRTFLSWRDDVLTLSHFEEGQSL